MTIGNESSSGSTGAVGIVLLVAIEGRLSTELISEVFDDRLDSGMVGRAGGHGCDVADVSVNRFCASSGFCESRMVSSVMRPFIAALDASS